jgi:hypothetical protein
VHLADEAHHRLAAEAHAAVRQHRLVLHVGEDPNVSPARRAR